MDVYNDKRMWGALAFHGVALILFGIAAVFWPGMTLVTLVYLFGFYVLASGIVNQIVGITNFRGAGGTGWGRILLFLLGALEVGLGVYLLRHPLVTFGTFILLIGLVLIVRGLLQLFSGIFGSDKGSFRVIMIIAGLLAVIVGVALLKQPAAGGVAFVWIFGLYALITGPMMVALAFEAKHALEADHIPAVTGSKIRTAR